MSYFNFNSLEVMDINQNKQSGRLLINIGAVTLVTHDKNGN